MISLIGYRGAGKTSAAQRLALRLSWDWMDADVEIELRAGKSIAGIFADDGEPVFRDLESAVLADVARRGNLVLACGGGAVLREENRRLLKGAGKVVWLKASPEIILARIAGDATTVGRRPPLTSQDAEVEVRQLLAVREPLYQECADLSVDTEGKNPADVVNEILKRLHLE